MWERENKSYHSNDEAEKFEQELKPWRKTGLRWVVAYRDTHADRGPRLHFALANSRGLD